MFRDVVCNNIQKYSIMKELTEEKTKEKVCRIFFKFFFYFTKKLKN